MNEEQSIEYNKLPVKYGVDDLGNHLLILILASQTGDIATLFIEKVWRVKYVNGQNK